MRFLIVDDSFTMRRIIVNTLTTLGYAEYSEASGGQEALEHVRREVVDIVIADWNMPQMNGVEFVRSLRELERGRHLPVIMVTTDAAKDDIVEALEAGVDAYLVKPFSADTMKAAIETALRRR